MAFVAIRGGRRASLKPLPLKLSLISLSVASFSLMPSLVERAFALADSGLCKTTAEIRQTLIKEGFTYADCDSLTGKSLALQLNSRIRAARSSNVRSQG
jgi:hypothetical protein